MANFNLSDSDRLVDIHGHDIPTTRGPNGELLCLLGDVKRIGANIYIKELHDELLNAEIDDSHFDSKFNEYIIKRAEKYLVENKVRLSDKIIMDGIKRVPMTLKNLNKQAMVEPPPQNILLKDRQIESGVDEDIIVRVANPSASPSQPKPTSGAANISLKPSSGAVNISLAATQTRTPPKATSSAQDHADRQRVFPQKGCFLNKTDEEKVTNVTKPNSEKKQIDPSLKKFSADEDHLEVAVVVTCIDKPNCIWVRDVANQGLLDQIWTKTNEEAVYQKVAQRPWVMDKVYMAKEDSWYRCKVVRYSPLIVFFVDYGTTAEVKELKEVSDQLARAPYLAVRVTFKAQQYTPRLDEKINIKIFHQNDDRTYFVTVLKQFHKNRGSLSTKPLVQGLEGLVLSSKHGDHEKPEKLNVSPIQGLENLSLHPKRKLPEKLNPNPKQEFPKFFKKPDPLCQLEDGQRAIIANVKNDTFYLRNKACFDKLRDIEKAIERYADAASSLQDVEVDQLVLFKSKSDGRYHRAVVTAAEKNHFVVDFLDFVEEHKAETLTAFKAINEELSREPVTYLCGGKLAGFEDTELGRGARDLISEYISKQKKFKVSLGFDDELDLEAGTEMLSHRLKNLPKDPKKIFLRDMTPFKPELGKESYVMGYYRGSKDLAIASSNLLSEHADYLIRTSVDDETPYEAEREEVCLCLYGDDWYRCAVLENANDMYQVFLLDFGNVEFVEKDLLRKPDDKIAELPTLALPCVLTGLPQHEKVENLLKKKIIDGEVYWVDVKRFSEGKYHVEVPNVYENIRDAL